MEQAYVKQDSPLRKIALRVLFKKFCGPNCGLRDLEVGVSSFGREHPMDINFYDMHTSLLPNDPQFEEAYRLLSNQSTMEAA